MCASLTTGGQSSTPDILYYFLLTMNLLSSVCHSSNSVPPPFPFLLHDTKRVTRKQPFPPSRTCYIAPHRLSARALDMGKLGARRIAAPKLYRSILRDKPPALKQSIHISHQWPRTLDSNGSSAFHRLVCTNRPVSTSSGRCWRNHRAPFLKRGKDIPRCSNI